MLTGCPARKHYQRDYQAQRIFCMIRGRLSYLLPFFVGRRGELQNRYERAQTG